MIGRPASARQRFSRGRALLMAIALDPALFQMADAGERSGGDRPGFTSRHELVARLLLSALRGLHSARRASPRA
jgi:hypothetical protein